MSDKAAIGDGQANDAVAGDVESRDLLDQLLIFARYKLFLVAVPIACAVTAFLLSFLVPKMYAGSAQLLPPQQGSSGIASALLAQLGTASSVLPSLPFKNPSDLYVGLLKSRTIADGLIEKFKLVEGYDVGTLTAARRELAGRTRIGTTRDGLILIEVFDEQPPRAAALANGYVEQLQKLTVGLDITEAAQRRAFFEQQLRAAKENLATSEVAFKQAQISTGLIRVDEQARAIVENIARLRAAISVREVELQGLRQFASARNPDLVRSMEGLK
jgi:tyrosine-protein kinase Etk/Wzc